MLSDRLSTGNSFSYAAGVSQHSAVPPCGVSLASLPIGQATLPERRSSPRLRWLTRSFPWPASNRNTGRLHRYLQHAGAPRKPWLDREVRNDIRPIDSVNPHLKTTTSTETVAVDNDLINLVKASFETGCLSHQSFSRRVHRKRSSSLRSFKACKDLPRVP